MLYLHILFLWIEELFLNFVAFFAQLTDFFIVVLACISYIGSLLEHFILRGNVIVNYVG